MFPDPLRIHYIIVLADDALEDASPFQGFGPSWPNLIWFEWLLDTIAQHRNESTEAVLARANSIIARSEAIRYIQLRNPENILIDDGSIRDIFVPEDVRKMLSEG